MIFSGKWLPVDQHFHLWPENDFAPSFSLQIISGNREKERERRESPDQREREREERAQIAPLVRWSHRADERRDRRSRSTRSCGTIVDRAARSMRSRSAIVDQVARSTSALVGHASLVDRRAAWSRSSIAPLVGRSHRTDEGRDRRARLSGRSHRSSIDERRDRWAVRVWQARSSIDDGTARRSSLIAPVVARRWFIFFCWVLVSFAWFDAFFVKIFEWTSLNLLVLFWICGLCFSDLCFPSSFPNTRKYFPENFLKCNQTPWKHFPFPKISISGKYVFSGKRFTATKHSLSFLPYVFNWKDGKVKRWKTMKLLNKK